MILRHAVENASVDPVTDAAILAILRGEGGNSSHLRVLFGDVLFSAILAAGGPDNVVVTVANPDIETAQRLFSYPGIHLLVVTGGEAVVHAARKSTDKRLIAAGAGNPPVVVDETADIAKAAKSIVWGASFDNNIICVDEKEVVVVDRVCDSLKAEMESRGNKLTPLPFLLMAVARELREHPRFNASLAPGGADLVLKQYCHVGIAVDTPQGLVVPVIRDVDRKSVWELAAEARELAAKARSRKLKLEEMQGGCFTISSLGSIGGEGFTPIVNAPEVAILGVSKLAVRPVWNGREFLPRKTLPLSLSYDHRVINGADAGNFLTCVVALLGDIRRLLL